MNRRATAIAYALAIVLIMITGCSPDRGGAAGPTGTPTPSSTSAAPASASPSHSAETKKTTAESTTRPLEPVPSVRPDGMVDPPAGHGMTRYTDQQVTWKPCPTKPQPGKQCATVLAPLDYRHPDAEAITLELARRPSAAAHPRGVLFTNPGGPGASGIDFIDYFNGHGLEQAYDIVSWDARGTGRSTPVQCFDDQQLEHYVAFDYSPDNVRETQQLIDLDARFGRACLAHSGALLEHISTEDTVRDLDLLRGLLGQRKLNYFGFSYGTSIGALYATIFGGNVGRMVLDGATSIGGIPEVSQTIGFDRTLGNFADWCAQQGCRLGRSKEQVQQTIGDLLTKLDQHPIPGGRRDLTQALATSGLIYAMYAPSGNWPKVYDGIARAVYNGDGQALLSWADAYNQRNNAGHYGQFNSSFPAIRCLDERDHGAAGEIKSWRQDEKRAKTFGPFIGPDLSCPTWPVAATGDTDRKINYAGTEPIVILGTTGDPATPYEYAVHMHRAFRSSELITLKGDGHLAFDQSRCVQDKVVGYFNAGQVPSTSRC